MSKIDRNDPEQVKEYTREKNTDNIPELIREFRKTNKVIIAKSVAKTKKESKERVSKSGKKYYQRNKEKIAEKGRRWRKENPEGSRRISQRRRARKAALPATLTVAEWLWLCEQTEGKCIYCGEEPEVLVQEHVVPVIQGGGYTIENIRPACQPCNSRKGGRTPKEAGMHLIEEYEETIRRALRGNDADAS